MYGKATRLVGMLLALCLFLTLAGCIRQTPIEPTESGNALTDENWEYSNGKGSYSMAVQASMTGENAPRLLKEQLKGEWMLHAELEYSSASENGDNHTGLVLYKDAENYLIWGPRNGAEIELSGRLNGDATAPLVTLGSKGTHLRIWKNTRDGEATRYYLYAATDAYYSFQYAGVFEDTDGIFETAKYGIMGEEAATDPALAYCAQYEFVNDYIVYNYKDYFNSAMLDGRWTQVNGAVSAGGGKVELEGESSILRRPLEYDWTIETQLDGAYDAQAGLLVDSGVAKLTFAVDDGKLTAAYDAQNGSASLFEQAKGDAKFLRIISREGSYTFEVSGDGKAFRQVAEYTDSANALLGAQYGLFAEDGGSFRWFCESATPDGVIKGIAYFEEKGAITGEESINQTQSKWGFGSGDLGTMFELDGAVYMVFGDTFQYANQGGNWYKNSIGRITDTENFQDGPIFDWMNVAASNGGLVNVRPNTDTGSMIATSGIGIVQDGVPTLYIHIMEIRRWSSAGTHWTTNGSGWASSTDGGNTWTLHDRIFEGDTNFAQLACYKSEDGYIYMLGAGAAGFGTVKLCRAPYASLTEKDGYEFFTGTDASGSPVWSPNEADAVTVIDSVNKEIAVVYDEGLGVFIMTTLDNVNQQMVYRCAENIWGSWSKPAILFDESYVSHEDIGQKFFYGSFMYSGFMEDEGRTVYMTLNKWVPYNIQWMKVHFETE